MVKNKKYFFYAVLAIGIGAVYAFSKASAPEELSKGRIDAILKAALAQSKNAPAGACLPLFGPGLPADFTTASLTDQKKIVDALIKNDLIKVDFNSGNGKMTIRTPGYEATGPDQPLSHVELTAPGQKFYQYSEHETTDSSDGSTNLVMVDRFCAHITYGGVEKFTPPAKNPFDDDPHKVTWVKFSWKVDQDATPWWGDGDLRRVMRIFYSPDNDGWQRDGILLEQGDGGRWALGNDPYTIRW